MENLDLKQMSTMVDVIAEEKGLPRDTVLGVIEQAIAAAWRKENGDRDMTVRAVLNTETGEADVYISRTVIEDEIAYNPSTEIPLKEAGEGHELGDIVEEKQAVKSFGRVAAMTAKQVVIQRLREAENDAVIKEFEDKIGTIVTGTIARVERRLVRIDFNHVGGIMPRSEQIEGEFYTVGNRIKVYVKNIEKGDRGAQMVLSRGNAEFIKCLFAQEVPELENGTVEIKNIVREAGRRTKIAVASTASGVDPVGTFVGSRGVRVQAVMNEIGDKEKIDIINWSDNASEFIREALSPAEINKVEIEGKKAKVYVSEEMQSIAIGKQGQNVRLASRLTGYDIDIELQTKTPKKKRGNVEDSLLSALEDAEDATDEKPEETPAPVEETANTEPEESTDKAEESTAPEPETPSVEETPTEPTEEETKAEEEKATN